MMLGNVQLTDLFLVELLQYITFIVGLVPMLQRRNAVLNAPRSSRFNSKLGQYELVTHIERDHEDAVVLEFAFQDGRIIDSRVAQVDVFEGPADVHAFAPLVLSADGIPDLPVHRQVGRPVAVRDG